MNIRFSGVHVTLVISPTDLRGGFHRLCSLAQDQLGINLSSGKEAVVFLSKTRKDLQDRHHGRERNDAVNTHLAQRTL